MDEIVEGTARLVESARLAYARKWSFLGLFACVFMASTLVLAQFDLLPEAPSTTNTQESLVTIASTSPAASITQNKVEMPIRIEIPSLALAASIANPDTTNASMLDKLLLKGAVRYPTSAKLGELGNVVVFGHSSYLPIVNNQAYKTFNEIQKLKQGDVVTIYSSNTAYTYEVRTVMKESANDGAIPLVAAGRVLTLATCNSFGTKSDRFVVTADFVESHLLGA